MDTLILGYGKTGKALAGYISEDSCEEGNIFVFDDKFAGGSIAGPEDINGLSNKRVTFFGDYDSEFISGKKIKNFKQCLVSPGIERGHKIISKFRSHNIPVYGEIEYAYRSLSSRVGKGQKPRIMAITGTNGKTTVTTLCKEAVMASGMEDEVYTGGNIGNPFISGVKDFNNFILEISSFQLEWIYNFKPDISVLLNVEDDHLDRYENFDEYRLTKYKMFKNANYNDVAILNYEDYNSRILKGVVSSRSVLFGFEEKHCDVFFKDDSIILKLKNITGYDVKISLDKIKDKKRYIIEDMMAAAAALCLFGIRPENIEKAFNSFKPLSHRVELVGSIGGIDFFDDSKATNPSAVISAVKTLAGMEGDLRDIALILGGKDKGFNYESLVGPVTSRVKACILIGETGEILREVLKGHTEIILASTMKDAVIKAFEFLRDNGLNRRGAVLLSPASSSFDMFKDYNERGIIFAGCFTELKQGIV